MIDSPTYPDRNATHDEWQWLEDIYGPQQLAWVDAQNDRTVQAFDAASFDYLRARILEVLDSSDRIPAVSRHGDWLYNLWKDADHPRGLWRRTTLDSYRTDDPDWDVLLDVDALGRSEGAELVFVGADLLYPEYDRALVFISPDGGDAFEVREFDLLSRTFLDDGFRVPSAKTGASWGDRDTVLISTDFGDGTMTTSSYPRQVRRWRRGEPLLDATLVHEVPSDHMGVWATHDHTEGYERDLIGDRVDFWRGENLVVRGGQPERIDVPVDAEIDVHRDWLLVSLRSSWEVAGNTWPAGALLATRFDEFLAGGRDMQAVFLPDERTSLVSFSWTRNQLLLTLLQDVASRIEIVTPEEDAWTRRPLDAVGRYQTVRAAGTDPDLDDSFWLSSAGYTQPETLSVGDARSGQIEALKHAPAFFAGSDFTVEQYFARSEDGTAVPYFLVAPVGLTRDGNTPTVLYGYGGFEISMTPGYSGVIGRAWLEAGGVYVVANIRGGGEYGPAWHQAALRENRLRAYEDFAAVARDLVARGVTSTKRLGCVGGSNGGLLVGNMLTRSPELFGAVVCEVPLLDMKRYTKLSAGASWIAEYGDPDNPDDWEFIQEFSPYHNLRDGIGYPPVLFYTATSDDRVGPVQARKMAARMQARGIPDVLFYENREGGHGGAADNAQRAHMEAMAYEFFLKHLMTGD